MFVQSSARVREQRFIRIKVVIIIIIIIIINS